MKKIPKLGLVLVALTLAVPALAQEVRIRKQSTNEWTTGVGWTTGLNLGPSGTWWREKRYIDSLSLTTEQQKKMDDVFQQYRIKLIDLTAALDKEEAILEPLLKAERLDEGKTAAQIDKVADARAALEKGNARMLLGIRQVLTPEQWTKLNNGRPVRLELKTKFFE